MSHDFEELYQSPDRNWVYNLNILFFILTDRKLARYSDTTYSNDFMIVSTSKVWNEFFTIRYEIQRKCSTISVYNCIIVNNLNNSVVQILLSFTITILILSNR